MTEGPEFVGGAGEASADPEHDESLEEGAGFEGHLPGIVAAEKAGVDAALEESGGEAGGGGLSGFEVGGELAGPGAATQEHEFEEMRVGEGEVQVAVEEMVEGFFEGVEMQVLRLAA